MRRIFRHRQYYYKLDGKHQLFDQKNIAEYAGLPLTALVKEENNELKKK